MQIMKELLLHSGLEGCLGRTKYIIVVTYVLAMRQVSADQVCGNQNRALGEWKEIAFFLCKLGRGLQFASFPLMSS